MGVGRPCTQRLCIRLLHTWAFAAGLQGFPGFWAFLRNLHFILGLTISEYGTIKDYLK